MEKSNGVKKHFVKSMFKQKTLDTWIHEFEDKLDIYQDCFIKFDFTNS